MSHFYGSIQGNASGTATRAGSKRSGIDGWVQNDTARVNARLWHDTAGERDFAEIAVLASTRNYGGGEVFRLPLLDINALHEHRSDKKIQKLLEEAAKLIKEANERAQDLTEEAKADRARERAEK